MAENPIKYEDLIKPDDSIENLIKLLERLLDTYNALVDNVKRQSSVVASSLKTVSGATEQGRQATKNATQEADRLTKAYKDLDYAFSDTAKRVAELKEVQKEQNMMNKLSAQSANAVAGSYNALSAQYRINKMAINNLTEEERKNDPAAKQLIKDTKEIYDKMNKMQQATGKFALNVGNYTNSINDALGAQSKWFKSMQTLGALFEGGFKEGIKSATTAVAAFGKELFAILANPVVAGIVACIAAITAAWKALAVGIETSEENTMRYNRVMAPFERIVTACTNVLQDFAENVLRGAEGLEKLTLSGSRWLEKAPLIGNAIKKINDALFENIQLTKEQNALTKAERENSIERQKLLRDAAKARKEANETKDKKEQIRLLTYADAVEHRIMINEINLANKDYEIKKKRAEQSKNDAKANDELAAATIRKLKAEEEYYNRTARLARRVQNLTNSGGTTSRKSTKPEVKEVEDTSKQLLAAKRAQEDAELELMEDGFDKERAKTIIQYDRQIEDLQNHLSKEEEIRNAQIATIKALEQQKWNALADISDKEMKDALDAETKDYNMRMKATDTLVKKKQDAEQKELEDEKKVRAAMKEVIQDSVDFAFQSLEQLMEGYLRAAEAKRQLADEEVDRAQTVLEKELEARAEGYASNVEEARRELELAKKTQQEAIKEEKSAQQKRAAIQTLEQVNNLVTASAMIWSQLGFPWAIPAIAIMFASFAASKAMAASAASSGSEEYGEGTVELLDGGSHQSGNDIDLGRKKDGTRRRAEGGEYFAVINKRNSRRYRDLIPQVINSLNDGTFAEKYMGAYGNGVNVNVQQQPDLSGLSRDVRLIREQGETSESLDGNGNTVMKYKNLRRIIRK